MMWFYTKFIINNEKSTEAVTKHAIAKTTNFFQALESSRRSRRPPISEAAATNTSARMIERTPGIN